MVKAYLSYKVCFIEKYFIFAQFMGQNSIIFGAYGLIWAYSILLKFYPILINKKTTYIHVFRRLVDKF